tara:strand:- start:373 stop:705 length:333 start_codon:yes stop_codon:yes gene_type:complete
MAYSGKPFFKIPRPLLLAGGVESQTISGDLELVDKDSLFQIIDGGGTHRVVTLPEKKSGKLYMIHNSGTTHNLIVKNPAGATRVTLGNNEMCLVVCDGTTWHVILNVNNL